MRIQIENFLWLSIGLLMGVFFLIAWRSIVRFIKGGFSSLKHRRRVNIYDKTKRAKLASTMFALLSVSIASWSFSYYAKHENIGELWIEIAMAVFGISTAGLLGGIVFEVFLRNEILDEVSSTLADIVTTDKEVIKELFTKEKRNTVIRTMLQINTDSDIYGDAIYLDLLKGYIDDSKRDYLEFRYDFSDDINFVNIDPDYTELKDQYYAVVDKISYCAELKPNNFVVGCASNEEQLYNLFFDPACVYRWLLKSNNFDELINSGFGFNSSLKIEGIDCEILNNGGEFTKRGFEMHFKNPFIDPSAPKELKNKVGQLVTFQIETHSLHPRNESFLSIHLAYPVKGVHIGFDYHDTNIRDVTKIHFMNFGENPPSIETGVKPTLGPKHHKVAFDFDNKHWLFPVGGIVFIW